MSIIGSNLADVADGVVVKAPDADSLPTTLANTQVYFDGVRAPLSSVSSTEIIAQVPFEFLDTTSINAWIRTVR